MPVSGGSIERVGAIASRQRGRVTRGQLLAAGLSSSEIGRMIEREFLRPEHAGVYAVVHLAPIALARETAALLACGDRAVLSHTSAGAVWGLLPESQGPVEITLACHGTGRRRPGITLHRSGELLQRDVRVHLGLPLTSPAWTLLDIATCLDTRSHERAFDEALVVRRLVRPTEIQDVLERCSGRRGAAPVRALLERRVSSRITHSQAERRCLELIREARLPEPLTQVKIGGYVVDLVWPEHRVVFEIDGFTYHTSRSAFDRDRSKDIVLKGAGYEPNRLTRDQVMFQPLLAIAAISDALARASERRLVR